MNQISIDNVSIDPKDWTLKLSIVDGGSNACNPGSHLDLCDKDGALLQKLKFIPSEKNNLFGEKLTQELLKWIFEANTPASINLSSKTSGPFSFFSPIDLKAPYFDLEKSRSMKDSISAVPSMPARCIDLYTDFLQNKHTVVEYGSGGSTLLSLQHGIKDILSVESDFNWTLALIYKFNKEKGDQQSNLHANYVNIGPTGAWGSPTTTSAIGNYAQYPIAPWVKAKKLNLTPELALIDGRFRVACFLSSLINAKPGTPIIFDDYNDRPQYHIVETIAKPIVRVDRQAIFITPEIFDRGSAHQIAMSYSTNPA
jgi:hypothetical protein